jgi:hypothetical protein
MNTQAQPIKPKLFIGKWDTFIMKYMDVQLKVYQIESIDDTNGILAIEFYLVPFKITNKQLVLETKEVIQEFKLELKVSLYIQN